VLVLVTINKTWLQSKVQLDQGRVQEQDIMDMVINLWNS
jgi:hypothetical protein